MRFLRHLLFILFACWGVSFLGFLLIYHSQGSVAYASISQGMSPAMKIQIEENLNLHQPFLVQYQQWLMQMLKGDLSTSLVSGESIQKIIIERLPATLILGGSSFVFLVIFSLILGLLSLFSSFCDRLINILGMSLISLPAFSIGLLLILFVSSQWGILPSSGTSTIGAEQDLSDYLSHLILPICTLILSHIGVFTQFVRATLIDAREQEFVYFGLARGLSVFYIYTHWVLKYALSPMVAYFSASFVSFMMSTYVVESVFSYGGIGESLIKGLIFKDYPLVLALSMLSFLAVLIVNLLGNLLCKWLNQGRI